MVQKRPAQGGTERPFRCLDLHLFASEPVCTIFGCVSINSKILWIWKSFVSQNRDVQGGTERPFRCLDLLQDTGSLNKFLWEWAKKLVHNWWLVWKVKNIRVVAKKAALARGHWWWMRGGWGKHEGKTNNRLGTIPCHRRRGKITLEEEKTRPLEMDGAPRPLRKNVKELLLKSDWMYHGVYL